MVKRILASSRYLIIIAVLGTFLTSILVLVYGGITVGGVAFETFVHGTFTPDSAKHLEIECIEIIDLFLLGSVLYIVALGLYELFIDSSLPLPSWLVIESLDDLKSRLIAVIIVLLVVTFLSFVVSWDGSFNILALGAAIGLVLFGLSFILGLNIRAFQTGPASARRTADSLVEEVSAPPEPREDRGSATIIPPPPVSMDH
jgi:uncharacterized membrane protein YqhA